MLTSGKFQNLSAALATAALALGLSATLCTSHAYADSAEETAGQLAVEASAATVNSIIDGQWQKTDAGQWKYVTLDGALTGLQQIEADTFYFDADGIMKTGWVSCEDDWYYFEQSGAMKKGWLSLDGTWYYLDPEDGKLVSKTGKYIDDVHYAFDADGVMYSDHRVKFDNGLCGYADDSGAVTVIGEYAGDKIILKDDQGETLTGWQKFADKWFYADEEGFLQTGWVVDGGKRYFINSNGVLSPNSTRSQKLFDAAQRVAFQGNGYCAKWTNTVYVAAGYAHPYANACDLYWRYCKTADLSQLEPGMIIAVPSHTRSDLGRKYGHVAIYLGNGMVRHNTNTLETTSLKDWLAYYETTYKAKCGWAL